ncbi:MAG: MarR family winged helix-turn-helix transcriptional regulator [Sedimentibacter sp.]
MNNKFLGVIGRLEKLSILRRIEANKISAEAGLYLGQLPILEYIIHHNGCTQKEIADIMSVSPASIATSTKRLQKSGLIKKQTDEENLRKNMLSVTEKGYEISKKCRESFDEFDKKLFNGFSDEELLSAKEHLDRLISNISNNSEIDCYSIVALRNESEKNNIKE